MAEHDATSMDLVEAIGWVNSEARLARLALAVEGTQARPGRGVRPSRAIPPKSLVRNVSSAIRRGDDPLGEIFIRLRRPDDRRVLGATYTPPEIVDAMLRWAKSHSDISRVIDPGAGSGRFSLASARAFPSAELVAVELDPLAASLARANLAASGLRNRSRVIVGDFRTIDLPAAEGRTLFIGNPPYVRHHMLNPDDKEWLTEAAGRRGMRASKLAGLHVHFFLAAAQMAQPGDIGTFITSSEWLDVNYGSLVRELFMDGLGGGGLHVFEPHSEPFEGASTTGTIACFQIGSSPTSVRMRNISSAADLGDLSQGRRVRRARLEAATRWTPLLRPQAPLSENDVELGEICRVHRGAVTGANRTFIVDPSETDLPRSLLVRSVTKARDLLDAGPVLASLDGLRAVVSIPVDLEALDPEDLPSVKRFLLEAERAGAAKSYVAQHRRAWWHVEMREPAPVLATYMARRSPAFVMNMAKAGHINVAHGLYPREPMSTAALKRMTASLNALTRVEQGRTYAGGLTKFEPREMERLRLPDPRNSST